MQSARDLYKVRIFAVGYEANFRGGAINLSPMHTEFRWVPVKSFQPRKLFDGGWRKGVEEYLRYLRTKRRSPDSQF